MRDWRLEIEPIANLQSQFCKLFMNSAKTISRLQMFTFHMAVISGLPNTHPRKLMLQCLT